MRILMALSMLVIIIAAGTSEAQGRSGSGVGVAPSGAGRVAAAHRDVVAGPGQSEVVVDNTLSTPVTVFINGRPAGTVYARRSELFVVSNGRHGITVQNTARSGGTSREVQFSARSQRIFFRATSPNATSVSLVREKAYDIAPSGSGAAVGFASGRSGGAAVGRASGRATAAGGDWDDDDYDDTPVAQQESVAAPSQPEAVAVAPAQPQPQPAAGSERPLAETALGQDKAAMMERLDAQMAAPPAPATAPTPAPAATPPAPAAAPQPSFGSFTDTRNNQSYRTVKIGRLTWMTENMNMPGEHAYNNWCYGDDGANCAKYGRLYTWRAAVDACPAGWRLPSSSDWDDLFAAAGGSFDADSHRWSAVGARLKSKTGWRDGGNGTDDFGFSALPGGFREDYYMQNPAFRFAGGGGYWWTADENSSYRAMGWDMSHVNENRMENDFGFSVLCVMVNTAPPAHGSGRPAKAAPAINTKLPMPVPDTRWYKAGTKTINYTITTADQLAGLAQLVNEGTEFEGLEITLKADIDLSAYGSGSPFNGGKGWIPIGGYFEDNFRQFKGLLNGNKQKIRGLFIYDPKLSNAGLFGSIGGNVNNLVVVDAAVTGGNYTGIIAGQVSGRVIFSYSTGAVNGVDYVGGVAGYSRGTILESYSTAAVTGERFVGGVLGATMDSQAFVEGCYFTGTVRGATDVGGVVGYIFNSALTDSYSTGTVIGRAGRVGGVVGRVNWSGKVSNCYATGAVSGREGTGGVAGSIVGGSTLTDCAALNSSVTGTGSSTGRVVGYVHDGREETLSNNAAFAGLKDRGGRTDRWTVKGVKGGDGADITAANLAADGTAGGRFVNNWTAEKGSLPGRGGKAVPMPAHLR